MRPLKPTPETFLVRRSGPCQRQSHPSGLREFPCGGTGWELFRSLGAAVLTPPPGNRAVCAALDLPIPTGVEHTDAFVLSAPPHAAIHLGPEGKLGGEGLDRIAGFWRVMGLRAPEDADHLGTLLMLYAELGEAERSASHERGPGTAAPGEGGAVPRAHLELGAGLPARRHRPRHRLCRSVGAADRAGIACGVCAARACRDAAVGAARPPRQPMDAADSLDETLDALVAPIRSGVVLTYRDLAECGHQVGIGLRRGERRFALRAMVEQDARGDAAGGSAHHARRWSQRSAPTLPAANDPCAWWSERAAETARVLETLVAEAQYERGTAVLGLRREAVDVAAVRERGRRRAGSRAAPLARRARHGPPGDRPAATAASRSSSH